MLQPLSGLRVLDFTAFPPGAITTIMLADLGAEVIRVESPALKGKPSLVFGQVPMSRAKKSITLDLRHEQANDVLRRLAPSVDIVIDNARPGMMEQRGFGYSQARGINPGLVWCAITGFGQDGPYAEHSGHDISFLGHSGLLTQISADPTFQPGLQMAVPYGALCAVIGIQGALLERARTGEGAFVDISLSEAASWVTAGGVNPLSDSPYLLTPTPDRYRHVCADGRQVVIACAEPRTWAALCDGLGLPEYKDRLHRWGDDAAAMIARIGEILATRPAMEWIDRLAPTGVAITIVNHGSQLAADPQARARGTVVDCAGTPVPANPVRMTSAAGSTGTRADPPPTVGQHNAELFASAGYSDREVEALAEAGVI